MISNFIISFIIILQISIFSLTKSFHCNKNYLINSNYKKISLLNHNNHHHEIQPKSSLSSTRTQVNQLFNILSITSQVALLSLITPKNVKAIGDMYELKDQNMVIQDISFNLQDIQSDIESLQALFMNKCRVIKTIKNKLEIQSILAFGANTYKSPDTFLPGISDFQEDGGHSTITLFSKNFNSNNELEIYEKGNGLQFIKFGAESIRLSKAIEKGVNIKFAYGWVDLDTPSGIPCNIVVGITRDPIMCIGIHVSNMEESLDFFINKLGMQEMQFPLARANGSNFEAPPPIGSKYISYSNNNNRMNSNIGMGLLLIPFNGGSNNNKSSKKSKEILNIGTQLKGITIIINDLNPIIIDSYSIYIKDLLFNNNNKTPEVVQVQSPDGYSFILKPYSVYMKEVVESVPLPESYVDNTINNNV